MYHIKPHLSGSLYDYFRNKELDELYAFFGLREFALSLIGIFVPIYLLTLGFSLQGVAVYSPIHYTAIILFYPLSIYTGARWVLKKNSALVSSTKRNKAGVLY